MFTVHFLYCIFSLDLRHLPCKIWWLRSETVSGTEPEMLKNEAQRRETVEGGERFLWILSDAWHNVVYRMSSHSHTPTLHNAPALGCC